MQRNQFLYNSVSRDFMPLNHDLLFYQLFQLCFSVLSKIGFQNLPNDLYRNLLFLNNNKRSLNFNQSLLDHWLLNYSFNFLDYYFLDNCLYWNFDYSVHFYDSIDHSWNNYYFFYNFFNFDNLGHLYNLLHDFLLNSFYLFDSFEVLLNLYDFFFYNVDRLLSNNLMVNYPINFNNLVLVKNNRNLDIDWDMNNVFSMLVNRDLYYSVNGFDYLNVIVVFDNSFLLPQHLLNVRNHHLLLNNLYLFLVNWNLPDHFYFDHHFISGVYVKGFLHNSLDLFDYLYDVLHWNYFLNILGMHLNLCGDVISNFLLNPIDFFFDDPCLRNCFHDFVSRINHSFNNHWDLLYYLFDNSIWFYGNLLPQCLVLSIIDCFLDNFLWHRNDNLSLNNSIPFDCNLLDFRNLTDKLHGDIVSRRNSHNLLCYIFDDLQ